MDDRELEARLRAVLHRRFDRATPSAALERSVAAIFAEPAPHARGPWFVPRVAWAAGTLAIAAVLLVALTLRPAPIVGPSTSPSPGASGAAETSPSASVSPLPSSGARPLIVLPTLVDKGKAEYGEAYAALLTRIDYLGGSVAGQTTVDSGEYIRFDVNPGGPSDDQLRDALSAHGVISLVGLPAPIPEIRVSPPVVGQPLSRNALPQTLIGPGGSVPSTGFLSYELPGDHTTLTIHLSADASRIVNLWTTDHIGDQVALLIDGIVVAAPTVQSPISGDLVITVPQDDPVAIAALVRFAAIARSPLPPAWSRPTVPALISQDRAEALALELAGSSTPPTIGSNVDVGGTRVDGPIPTEVATWMVEVDGTYGPSAGCGAVPTPTYPAVCHDHTARIVLINAETGQLVGTVF